MIGDDLLEREVSYTTSWSRQFIEARCEGLYESKSRKNGTLDDFQRSAKVVAYPAVQSCA